MTGMGSNDFVCGGRPGCGGNRSPRPAGKVRQSSKARRPAGCARVWRRPPWPSSKRAPPRRHRRRRDRASARPTHRPPPERPVPGCRTSSSAECPSSSRRSRRGATTPGAWGGGPVHLGRRGGTAKWRREGARVACDRQHDEAHGVASFRDPRPHSSPPPPTEGLSAPCAPAPLPRHIQGQPAPCRRVVIADMQRWSSRGDMGVARFQQRRDHATLFGGGREVLRRMVIDDRVALLVLADDRLILVPADRS